MTQQQKAVLAYGVAAIATGAASTLALEGGRTGAGIGLGILTAVLLKISIFVAGPRPR